MIYFYFSLLLFLFLHYTRRLHKYIVKGKNSYSFEYKNGYIKVYRQNNNEEVYFYAKAYIYNLILAKEIILLSFIQLLSMAGHLLHTITTY